MHLTQDIPSAAAYSGSAPSGCSPLARFLARFCFTASTRAADPMLIGTPQSGLAKQHRCPGSLGRNACYTAQHVCQEPRIARRVPLSATLQVSQVLLEVIQFTSAIPLCCCRTALLAGGGSAVVVRFERTLFVLSAYGNQLSCSCGQANNIRRVLERGSEGRTSFHTRE